MKDIIKKSFGYKNFSKNLAIIMLGYSITLLVTMILFFYFNIKYPVSTNSLIIASVVLGILISLLFFSFIKRVFYPILKIDEAIKILEDSKVDFEIPYNNNEITVSDNLNKMLINLKLAMQKEYSLNVLKKQAELNALQSQINPHFLYNTLEAIRGEALMEGMDDIADMTEALGKFFRYSISGKVNFVTIREELNNVKTYFKIQKYRFNNRFSLKVILDDNSSEILDYKIPKLTIQPMIENSIYHGLEPKIEDGNITIRVIETKKKIVIVISDNGVGISEEVVQEINKKLKSKEIIKAEGDRGNGIALINVNERIRLFFGDEFGVTISSTLNVGTEIELSIPKFTGDSYTFTGMEKVL